MHSLNTEDLRALSRSSIQNSKNSVQNTKPAEAIEKPKKSSFLSAPSSLGISNLLFGPNENENGIGNGKIIENSKVAEKDLNQKKNVENTLSGNAKNFLSAGVGRVFKRTSDGQENRPEKVLSPSDTPPSSSSFFSPFSTANTKKEHPKLDENIPDVCEFLSLLEICFMHGIRVKEFHGVLPLWTLLERLRLLTPQVVASMSVVDTTEERGRGSKSDNHHMKKNESSKLGAEQEVKKNSNSKDNIMASIRNKFDNLSHHTEPITKSSIDNSNTTEKHSHIKPTITSTGAGIGAGTDNMTPVLTSNPLRQSVGAIASISSLRSPVAKARAWIRYSTSAYRSI